MEKTHLTVEREPRFMYLSYTGIRVTDLQRSLKFYIELFGLKEVARGSSERWGGGEYVLLKDEKSGQKLELNSYSTGSRYDSPYLPGEGLDHLAFRVNNLKETLEKLRANGIQVCDEASYAPSEGTFVSYVKDPDGNWIELYQHPRPLGRSVPEGY